MNFGFVKILGSQESGYSVNVPNQRGKYVLINKGGLEAFPPLSSSFLNDQVTIRCRLPSGDYIGLHLVYHNAIYFPETHKRAHDEVRLYRNKEFEEGLNADRGVLVVFYPLPHSPIGNYALLSFRDSDSEFQLWNQFHGKSFNVDDVTNFPSVESLKEELAQDNEEDKPPITEDVSLEGVKIAKAGQPRTQQEPELRDPATPLTPLIQSQQNFSQYLRKVYDYKCCIRGIGLVENSNALGLEAAHIRPHTHGGPLLPTNGILLSADLHKCFDKGAFTLTDDLKVEVHPEISKSSALWNFDATEIKPSPTFEIFKPFGAYVDYHRENIFKRYSNT